MHPSDAVSGMAGIPTLDSRPTVPLNFMTTTVISAPDAASWGANILLNPSPLYFGKVATKSATPAYGTSTIYNTQLGVTGFGEFGAIARNWNNTALDTWFKNVSKFRLCYASVTATLSASATSNEGTVTAAQYPLVGRESFVSATNLASPAIFNTAKQKIFPCGFRTGQVLQGMIGSTTWEAREGAYAILKMSEDALQWNTPQDVMLPLAIGGTVPTFSGVSSMGGFTDFSPNTAATAADTPFGPQGLWGNYVISGTGATYSFIPNGAQTLVPTQDYLAHLVFTGLDPTATITLTYRVGFEAVVPPESIYAGQVTPALQPDPLALQTYFSYSSYLQSAYPASYNIFGALLTGLKTIGRAAMPHLIEGGKQLLGSVLGGGSASPTTGAYNVTTSTDLRPPPMAYRQEEEPRPRARVKARRPARRRLRTRR